MSCERVHGSSLSADGPPRPTRLHPDRPGDLRAATPAARGRLDVHRPAWLIGTAYPWAGNQAPVRLATSYDLVVHFPEISAARLR